MRTSSPSEQRAVDRLVPLVPRVGRRYQEGRDEPCRLSSVGSELRANRGSPYGWRSLSALDSGRGPRLASDVRQVERADRIEDRSARGLQDHSDAGGPMRGLPRYDPRHVAQRRRRSRRRGRYTEQARRSELRLSGLRRRAGRASRADVGRWSQWPAPVLLRLGGRAKRPVGLHNSRHWLLPKGRVFSHCRSSQKQPALGTSQVAPGS